MLVDSFMSSVIQRIGQIRATQMPAIDRASHLVVDAMADRHRTFAFGSGHSGMLVQEICIRAGGLPIFNPIFAAGLLPTDFPYIRSGLLERLPGVAKAILDTTPVAPGDVLLVVSNSGRNCVPVEMALEAQARGMSTIVLTSVEFSQAVTSRHPSGKRLLDIADVVLDNCAPPGDGTVDVPGTPAKLAPLSTILGAVVLHSLACRVCELLIERDIVPPVFTSGNADDGDERYYKIVDEYRDLMAYL